MCWRSSWGRSRKQVGRFFFAGRGGGGVAAGTGVDISFIVGVSVSEGLLAALIFMMVWEVVDPMPTS